MSAKPGDRVRVRGWADGVACYVVRPEMVLTNETCERCGECVSCEADDDSLDCDWPVWSEPDEHETGRLIVCMVGDDYRFAVEPEDCTPIERDDYCGECGQIGCTHDGYDRSVD